MNASSPQSRTVLRATPSKAAFRGHPIHPMLVTLPIGLTVAALGADIGYWIDGAEDWANASLWLTGGALLSGILAAAAGAVDYFGRREVQHNPLARAHGIGNAIVLLLLLASLLIRLPDTEDGVLPWGIILSAAACLVLSITGWLGGELSYRHLIGVNPSDDLSRYR